MPLPPEARNGEGHAVVLAGLGDRGRGLARLALLALLGGRGGEERDLRGLRGGEREERGGGAAGPVVCGVGFWAGGQCVWGGLGGAGGGACI